MRDSALRFLARRQFGSLREAALHMGLHPNTLQNAAAGVRVCDETREKIETTFGASLSELQQPLEAFVLERTCDPTN